VKILLITDSYPPEIRSASHLMLELAQELKRIGHEITVITTWPEYNLDQQQDFVKFNELEKEDGISVIRVKTLPHHNVNYILRAIAQLVMPLQFLLKLFKYHIRPDAAVVYSPPLPLAFVGSWLARRGVRYLLNVQDLFPQNAIDLGILRQPMQIKFFEALERSAYRNADIITVHSEGNRAMVLKSHPLVSPKLKILHNWVDVAHHDTNAASTDFREEWHLTYSQIAIFAGVMGPSQYLELILDIAERMTSHSDLLFLLVGDGKEKANLQRQAQERGLKNVRFEGFISRERYPDLLRACTIGLVCLSPQNKTPVVPGKILGHMASALPVAAFLQRESDGHALIAQAQCGVSADSSNLEACVNAMQNLLDHRDEFKQLGANGRRFATDHFSKEVCVAQLEAMLLDKNT
jgi:colanic acid biosynthesis glycosyl transferase WcaI